MTHHSNPKNRGKCPFYIIPTDLLSAEKSVSQCVNCVCRDNKYLSTISDDLRQIAFLTIIEQTPNYNPNHESGASYITFIKSKVCSRLWKERRRVFRDTPYSHQECSRDCEENQKNPLTEGLNIEACAIENVADTVIHHIEVEFLRKRLPKFLKILSDKERRVIEMKFFEECSGVDVARTIGISEGRVTQITQKALVKLGKAYLAALETEQGNPYRQT